MIKIRIAVASGLLAALLAGGAVHAASPAQPTHTDANPVLCCSVVIGHK